MARRLLAQHPTGHPGQGAVWLTDHKDVRPLMAIPTRDRNRQTEARVEWVEDPSFSLLISASMSLLRPVRGSRILPSLLRVLASVTVRAVGSSTPSFWSTGLRPRAGPGAR